MDLFKQTWVVHRDLGDQSDDILKYGRKIKALGPMWPSTMQQNFGLSGTLTVSQIYIQLETDDSMGGVIYSYPAVLGDFTKLAEVIEKTPDQISELYRVCKEEEEAVVNYAMFDIAEQKERRVSVAFPIKSKVNDEMVFKGAVIWESQLNQTFKQTIIPDSFTKKDYPFIQFRMPQHPEISNFNDLNQEFKSEVEPKKYYGSGQIVPVPVIPDKDTDGGGGKEFTGPKVPTGIRRVLQKQFGGGGSISDTWDGDLPPDVQPAPPQEEDESESDDDEVSEPVFIDPFVLDLPLG